ncbi:MAG: HIRAN domain-containing protein [Candidatus Xenobium sp.]|nr:restriction endonuclease [Burkholderiales bacterium]
MSESLVPLDSKSLAILGSASGAGLSLPFAREIFLMECRVAGTSHLDLQDLEAELEPGNRLECRREPENPHDSLAILLQDAKGRKLGYVPRERNEVLARLLDAGKVVFGRLEAKKWVGNWLKLEIRVFLQD